MRRDMLGTSEARDRETVPSSYPSILKPGTNCSNVALAARAAVLIDGAGYFTQLQEALESARSSIFILGWDFDGGIRLRPDLDEERSPRLGDLLRRLVEERPALQVHILVWSVSVVHGPSAVAPALLGSGWEDHPRIHMKLDTSHPIYGAHHQKIVCIDGKLAFVGGIDLTVHRWDSQKHRPDDPLRVDADGVAYPPVHDAQMLVDGDAAASLCRLACERWQYATGESLDGRAGDPADDPWPAGLEPDFRDCAVAVARTAPAYGGRKEACEVGLLTADMIAAARREIYIEAQYMTAQSVGDALARRLAEPDGPDVIVVMTLRSRGLIERFAMANNRDRLIRRLARADRFRRLRVLYPVVPCADGEEEQQVLVHSKIIIIDDMLLRVGSSNLNNRSIGLDTECDLAVEARSEADRAGIAAVRNRLLAEHLDCSERLIRLALADGERLARLVDRFNVRPRGLRAFPAMSGRGPTRPAFGTALLDPIRPFRLGLPSRLRWPTLRPRSGV